MGTSPAPPSQHWLVPWAWGGVPTEGPYVFHVPCSCGQGGAVGRPGPQGTEPGTYDTRSSTPVTSGPGSGRGVGSPPLSHLLTGCKSNAMGWSSGLDAPTSSSCCVHWLKNENKTATKARSWPGSGSGRDSSCSGGQEAVGSGGPREARSEQGCARRRGGASGEAGGGLLFPEPICFLWRHSGFSSFPYTQLNN